MRKLIWVAIAAAGLSGCGESTGEAAAEAMASQMLGQDVEVDADGETVTIGDVRMSSGKAAVVPDDFPSDVFLPDDYTMESLIQSPQSTALHMNTPVAVDALYADATDAMAKAGWTAGWNMPPSEGTGMASFEKDDRRATLTMDDRGEEGTFYTVETGVNATTQE